MEKSDMIVKILRKDAGTPGEKGREPFARVEIIDPTTGESGKFICRNIFDFGYVVNPLYPVAEGLEPGGMVNEEEKVWMYYDEKRGGWYNVRPLTAFERKAVEYLEEFPPICADLRM